VAMLALPKKVPNFDILADGLFDVSVEKCSARVLAFLDLAAIRDFCSCDFWQIH
jgi:hypothetical protein